MSFAELFALAAAGPDHWTAPGAPPTAEAMVFGGLVIAQALLAASTGTRRCHSLHALFIGMGEKQQPFKLAVECTRDGGSFATRHVRVTQQERLLLTAYTSHHDGNEGPAHQIPKPPAPDPETLEDFLPVRLRQEAALGRPLRYFLAEQMLDVRHVLEVGKQVPEATQSLWFRPRLKLDAAPRATSGAVPGATSGAEPRGASPAMHQAVIAFASDIGLVHAGLRNYREPGMPRLQTASLDHSIWFHCEASADDWLLYVLHAPIVGNGRGMAHGQILHAAGTLWPA